jgi:predicted transport protein
MPILEELPGGTLKTVSLINFSSEKELQSLIEFNLEEVFGCRFIATEFSTGSVHSGRIDTLALSEDGNPVIIEYKKVENSNLVNQGLFYLDWIKDHKGDFELAVQKALGDVNVDWSHVRVICLAPSFDKYSLHAVNHIDSGLELWRYHRYQNKVLEIEEVFRASDSKRSRESKNSLGSPLLTKGSDKEEYNFEQHLNRASTETEGLVIAFSEFMSALDDSIAEVPQKFYVAYKLAKNIACLEVHKKKITIFLSLDYEQGMPEFARDVSNIGHYGTGNLEISVSSLDELEMAKPFIEQSYRRAGGN